MADTAAKIATYQDIADLPENLVGELIHGALYTQPRPRPRHVVSASRLGGVIGDQFDWGGGPGGWTIVIEPEVHLGENVLVPDIAGWRAETLPKLPDEAYFSTPPDWVCEVLSPSTAQKDRVLKADLYLAEGVGHMWLLDPEARYLEAFEAADDAWRRLGAAREDGEVALAPFAAAPFKLDTLWAD